MPELNDDQLRLEQLSDREWRTVCELFALILYLRDRLDNRLPESRTSAWTDPEDDFFELKQVGRRRDA